MFKGLGSWSSIRWPGRAYCAGCRRCAGVPCRGAAGRGQRRGAAGRARGNQLRFLAGPMPSQDTARTYPSSAIRPAGRPGSGFLGDVPGKRCLAGSARSGPRRDRVDHRDGHGARSYRSSKYAAGQYLYERFDHDVDEAYLAAYCKIRRDWAATFGKPSCRPPRRRSIRRLAEGHDGQSPPRGRLGDRDHGAAATAELRTRWPSSTPSIAAVCPMWTCNGGQRQAARSLAGGRLDLPAAESPNTAIPGWGGGDRSSILPRKSRPGCNHDIFRLSNRMTMPAAMARVRGRSLWTALWSVLVIRAFIVTRSNGSCESRWCSSPVQQHWGTNFQQWICGSWSSCVRLWPKTDEALLVEHLDARRLAWPRWRTATQGRCRHTGRRLAFLQGELIGLRPVATAGRGCFVYGKEAGRNSACKVGLPAGSKRLSPNRATSVGGTWAGPSRPRWKLRLPGR